MAFVFTPEMDKISNQLWAVTSAVGAGLCFFVLLVIAAVWYHPKSRAHLDRVSFRIVIYALLANLIFGIASAVAGFLTAPGFLCGFSVFILQLTLQLSSFLLFSISLNLQLVVVHGINGQRMEKFYLIASACISVVLTVPTYAAKQYGWDPLVQDCWYTNDNPSQRTIWQVTTQLAWTALAALGEIICSTTVLIFMLKHSMRLRRVYISKNSRTMSHGLSTISPQVIHANHHKQIILRIALYPIASCFVNLLSIVCVLHATVRGGLHNMNDYRIALLSDFLYGGRAIVYALLAAADPALVRGVKTLFAELFYHTHSRTTSTTKHTPSEDFPDVSTTVTVPPSSNPLIVHIELSTMQFPPDKSLADKSGSEGVAVSSEAIHKTSNEFGSQNRSEAEFGGESLPAVADRGTPVLDLQRRYQETQRQEQDAFRRQI